METVAGTGEQETTIVSRAEFARLMGWNRSTVTKYADAGKLVSTDDGRIDVEASKLRLAASRNPAYEQTRARHERERVERELHRPAADASLRLDTNDPSFRSLQKSRAQAEATKARLLQLELDEREGKLLDADTVQRTVFAVFRGLRNRLQQIPSRLAPVVAAESDPFRVEQHFDAELRRVLGEIDQELRTKGMSDAR